MPSDRSAIAGRSLPDRTRTAASSVVNRSSLTNAPASRWNLRSASGRRCRDLFVSFMEQAGNPVDPAKQAAILAASEQVVIAEIARDAFLADAGQTKTNLEMVIRAENLANRTLRRLKLDKPVSTKRAGPSLADIRARYATPATSETPT